MLSRRPTAMLFSTVLLVSGALLGACGGDETAEDPTGTSATPTDSADPTESAEEPEGEADAGDGLPSCTEVWVDGATLPEEYDGCVADDGSTVAAESIYCEAGAGLFTHEDRFYAAAGARVNEVEGSLADSDQFQTARESCGG